MKLYCLAHTPIIKNYIGIKFKSPDQIVIIHDPSLEDKMHKYRLKNYLMHNGRKNIELRQIESYSKESIGRVFDALGRDDALVLPPIEKVKHLAIYQALSYDRFECLFIDDEGVIYRASEDGYAEYQHDDVHLTVKDFIKKTEGRIIETNSALFDQEAAEDLLEYFVRHMHVLRNIIKSKNPMLKKPAQYGMHNPWHNPWHNPHSTVKCSALNAEERRVYVGALKILERNGVLELEERADEIDVTFNSLGYRDYFAKMGTWLEHYTYESLKRIEGVHDVNSSVQFIWNENFENVKNELDVMAVYGNQLITISCKDTNSLEDDHLYELESHADQLSNEDTIKAIVTTSEPREHIAIRAKQLGIHIIVFNGNSKRFLDDMKAMLDH